ncbi:VWA-like domain-containing protein [Acaryochloris sp. IP29b_bin.137]|uniref:vWA domain-containing protein n=1 Tax=Acaryochloris sp. IP29b_bin.137 TaxID=2969217 RepID=UPI002638BEA0|nr:VWA-like domain-containing protein [Acaryochloris sp. IP29b_bin.137]
MSTDSQKLISASLLRLRMKSPFFATLALFARFVPSQCLSTAATDGKDIFFNAEYLRSLPSTQQDGLLLHEVLHAALMHAIRRGVRDPKPWNIAADIVVNGIIAQQDVFELPPNPVRDKKLENLSVEEIYELLQKEDSVQLNLPNPDLLGQSPEDANPSESEGNTSQAMQAFGGKEDVAGKRPTSETYDTDQPATDPTQVISQTETFQNSTPSNRTDSLSEARKATLEVHWRNALQQATIIARTTNQGRVPAGIERELMLLTTPQLDWRAYLWRYLVQTPTDFLGFDRRFIGQGLYLESLVGESVKVYVAVDTSGSIDQSDLRMFLSEVQGILRSYPHLQCELYYVDADAYGPHELNPNSPIPQPQGGGGTSFQPFFKKVDERWDRQAQAVCVYLTDGYGEFPDPDPELPVLWVVTPGGLMLNDFPCGEAVRLLPM